MFFLFLLIGTLLNNNIILYISMGGIIIFLILKNIGIYGMNDLKEDNKHNDNPFDSIDIGDSGDGD